MSDIDEIKARLDIADVVGGYVQGMKRAGRSYKARCPFHNEKTPSFTVSPDLGTFKCFGCGEYGDVISFIQKVERVDFGKALEIAAAKAGYQLQQKYSGDSKINEQKNRISEVNLLAAKYWNYLLTSHPAGEPGKQYAKKRQLRDQEIEKFLVGYAPKGNNVNLITFLNKKGFTTAELIQWGLATENNGKVYDKFRDRLILSIWDMQGNIIGFSGRLVTPNEFAPKYLNSPETLIYKKSEILMGLYQAKDATHREKFLILEEGNIDLLSSHRVGIENIAAVGGTALTEQQVKLVQRHAETVYFCFDIDAAGHKALLKGIELAEKVGLPHKVIDIGESQDPDALISQNPTAWKEAVANPVNTIEFLLAKYRSNLDLTKVDDKRQFRDLAVNLLRLVQDPVTLQHFTKELSLLLEVDLDAAKAMLSGKTVIKEPEVTQNPDQTNIFASNINQGEIELLALLVNSTNIADLNLSAEVFNDPIAKELYLQIYTVNEHSLDFSSLIDRLSDPGKELLQRVLTIDISYVDNVEKEIHKKYTGMYDNYIKQELINLRKQLTADPTNEQLMTRMQYLVNERSRKTANS